MLRRLFTGCLIRPNDLPPSRDDMEVVGAFNPGAVAVGDEVVLLVRVAERPRKADPGCTALPRYESGGEIVVDQVPNKQLVPIDSRVVQRAADGCKRLTFVSHLRVLRSKDGRTIDSFGGPRFIPENEYETFGVEDPRITRIGDRFYFTYVAVSARGAATALASTTDFHHFERHGIIFCPENKDVVLFPEKIGGQYLAMHRPNPATHFSPPEIWLARSDDLRHWGGHEFAFGGERSWSGGRVGAGCPPVRTERGWLEIYHGNNKLSADEGVGAYFAGILLMDHEDPARIVSRGERPIMRPETDFEMNGFVPNVVFPTGLIERGDTFLIYYGAADTYSGVVGFARDELLGPL